MWLCSQLISPHCHSSWDPIISASFTLCWILKRWRALFTVQAMGQHNFLATVLKPWTSQLAMPLAQLLQRQHLVQLQHHNVENCLCPVCKKLNNLHWLTQTAINHQPSLQLHSLVNNLLTGRPGCRSHHHRLNRQNNLAPNMRWEGCPWHHGSIWQQCCVQMSQEYWCPWAQRKNPSPDNVLSRTRINGYVIKPKTNWEFWKC